MSRARSLALWALTLLGCGGVSAPPSPAPPLPFGGLPEPALTAWLNPHALADDLDALEARVGDATDALGPVGVAWRRARTAWTDFAAEWTPEAAAPTIMESWGLSPTAPVWVQWAAADEGRLPRRLMAALQGQPAPEAAPPVWQIRAGLRLADEGRLHRSLDRVAARLGWIGATGPWAQGLTPPPDLAWWAWDPSGRVLVALRTRGAEAVLDVVAGVPAAQPAALAARLPVSATRPAAVNAPAHLRVRLGGLAMLQAATGAAVGLQYDGDASVRLAAAEVVAACTDQLADAAGQVRHVDVQVAAAGGRPQLVATAQLTAAGARWWASAQRPRPFLNLEGLPAAWQLGVARLGKADPFGLARCPGVPPAIAVVLALPLVPGWIDVSVLPLPEPPAQPTTPVHGLAAAVLGASARGGAAAPVLAGVVVGPSVEGAQPLGPAAVAVDDPAGRRWLARGGGLSAHLAQRRVGGRPARVYALGLDTLDAIDARLGGAAGATWFEAVVDPASLAQALGAAGAGAEVGALRALAAHLGRFVATGTRVGAEVRLRAGFESAGDLDHRPPAK